MAIEIKDTDNYLLYDYIQLAFDHVQKFSWEPAEGDPVRFLNQLYRSRTNSVFSGGDLGEPKENESMNDIGQWLGKERTERKDGLLAGTLDDMGITPDASEAFSKKGQELFNAYNRDSKGGCVSTLGIEAYATYMPIHFFFSGQQNNTDWGIYISEDGVARLGALLQNACYKQREMGKVEPEKEYLFLKIAYQILLRHELTHFRIESFSLSSELVQQRPLYAPYLYNIYANKYGNDDCLEEALANAAVLDSVVIRNLFNELYPKEKFPAAPYTWREVLARNFFDLQPKGYTNYDFRLCRFLDESASHFNFRNRKEIRKITPRALGMNYLCNQILCGEYFSPLSEIPFFTSLPDNYFLRAENLVPIHVLRSLDNEDIFIRLAPPKKKSAQDMLYAVGYRATDRGKGDHVVWVKPGWDEITINYDKSGELDWNSRKNMIQAFGITKKEFEQFQTTKRMPESLNNRLMSIK